MIIRVGKNNYTEMFANSNRLSFLCLSALDDKFPIAILSYIVASLHYHNFRFVFRTKLRKRSSKYSWVQCYEILVSVVFCKNQIFSISFFLLQSTPFYVGVV